MRALAEAHDDEIKTLNTRTNSLLGDKLLSPVMTWALSEKQFHIEWAHLFNKIWVNT